MVAIAFTTAGCTQQAPITTEVSTGDAQVITGAELTGTEITGEVLTGIVESGINLQALATGSIDSGVVPTLTGSTGTSSVLAEFKALINKRNTQPKDESKLNEEDIGLIEQFIQKVQNIGKK